MALNKTTIGYIIIGVCTVIFCILVVSAVALKEKSYDADTLCRNEISAHTIVVLDKTDSLSIKQRRYILEYINKEKNKLGQFEKFSIFTLTENVYMSPQPVFSKCNPGTGTAANMLYQNPKKIQNRFNEFFSAPLIKNVRNMLSDNTGAKSPIFEMIKALSVRDDFDDNMQTRSLIIISDMMHHTSDYSHYKNSVDYEYFLRKSYADEVASSLNAVNVKIVYLLRDNLGNIQGNRHLLFWKDYFEEAGAMIAEVRTAQ